MAIVVPFMMNNNWYGIDLEYVKSIESIGVVTIVPNAQVPTVGLMQKKGVILPVWVLSVSNKDRIALCPYYIQMIVDGKVVALPVEKVNSVIETQAGWVPFDQHGVKFYRALDKKPPTPVQKDSVIEIQPAQENNFYENNSLDNFKIENFQA